LTKYASMIAAELGHTDPAAAARFFETQLAPSFGQAGPGGDGNQDFFAPLRALRGLTAGLYSRGGGEALSWLDRQTGDTRNLGFEQLAKVAAKDSDRAVAKAALDRLKETDRFQVTLRQVYAVAPDLMDYQSAYEFDAEMMKRVANSAAGFKGTKFPE